MASPSSWTVKQNKQFEDALAKHDQDTPNRWHKIARAVTGKSAEEVERHYEDLAKDIMKIENDQVPIPDYGAMPSKPNARGGLGYNNEHRLMKNLKLQ